MTVKTEEKIDSVGEVAGLIWSYLSRKSRASAVEIKNALSVKNSLLFMGLGWLARANKIELSRDSGIYYFKLIDK